MAANSLDGGDLLNGGLGDRLLFRHELFHDDRLLDQIDHGFGGRFILPRHGLLEFRGCCVFRSGRIGLKG